MWRELDHRFRSVSNHKALWADADIRKIVVGFPTKSVEMDMDAAEAQPYVSGAFSSIDDAMRATRHEPDEPGAPALDDDFATDEEEEDHRVYNTRSGKAPQAKKAPAKSKKSAGGADASFHYMFERMMTVQEGTVKAMMENQKQLLEQLRTQQDQHMAVVENMHDMMGAQERVRSRRMTVSLFDGKSENAEAWMMLFERACQANRWLDDVSKVNNLKSFLEPGSAPDIYLIIPSLPP